MSGGRFPEDRWHEHNESIFHGMYLYLERVSSGG
jgi:hypothetical protein